MRHGLKKLKVLRFALVLFLTVAQDLVKMTSRKVKYYICLIIISGNPRIKRVLHPLIHLSPYPNYILWTTLLSSMTKEENNKIIPIKLKVSQGLWPKLWLNVTIFILFFMSTCIIKYLFHISLQTELLQYVTMNFAERGAGSLCFASESLKVKWKQHKVTLDWSVPFQ